jgi:hypothetical protein
MQNSSIQNQTASELLEELKIYEEREKAFKIHLKMKDIEIQKLEKEIKKLRGDINQSNMDENENEDYSSISNDEMKQEKENENEDKNIYLDPYYNEYLNELINIIKYKNREYQDKNQKWEQLQANDNNNTLKQGYKRCRELVKENLELYNYFQAGILENLKFENGLEKNQIELLMIKLKALEQYKNELEYETKEANDKINGALEKL